MPPLKVHFNVYQIGAVAETLITSSSGRPLIRRCLFAIIVGVRESFFNRFY
jgi:hypothetical protein